MKIWSHISAEKDTDDDDNQIEDMKVKLEETLGKKEFSRQLSRQISVKEIGRSNSNSESQISQVQIEKSGGTNVEKEEQKIGTTLIDKESVETGSVSTKVYIYYMSKLGMFGTLLGLFSMVLYQGSGIGTNYWVSLWAENSLNR